MKRQLSFADPGPPGGAPPTDEDTLEQLALDHPFARAILDYRGMAKLKIGVAKGKKLHDKREDAAKRDWSRQKSRLLKDHG